MFIRQVWFVLPLSLRAYRTIYGPLLKRSPLNHKNYRIQHSHTSFPLYHIKVQSY